MRLTPTQALWLSLPLLLAGVNAGAQPAPDPTRPPDAWLALHPQAQTADAAPDNPNAGARVTVLGKGRRYALVDGQIVKPGDTVNGARVVAIRAEAVTLRQNDTTQVLSLTPGVVKKLVKPAKTVKRKAPVKPAQ